MSKNSQLYSSLNQKLAIILSLSFSALFAFMFAGIISGGHHEISLDISEANVLILAVIRFITSVLTFYLLYEFCFCIFRKKWENRKKHLAAFLGTFVAAMLISLVLSMVVLLFLQTFPDDLQHLYIRLNLKKDMVSAVIVFLSTLFILVLIRNQQTLVENQRLVAENIRNRHEALKNQLNPHFLFNSLNTLDGLIGFDDNKAHNYLQHLSSTFRYTIQNMEITTLKEELQFVRSYAYLLKIRYGENLCIQYAIDEKYHCYNILPISVQLLIENAIKHNIINDRHPLTINIETTERDTIITSNAIQPKIDAETGEGIGLANLVERYRLLFGMDVTISKNGVFTVEIPLISNKKSKIK